MPLELSRKRCFHLRLIATLFVSLQQAAPCNMRCTRPCCAPQVEAAQALGVEVLEALAAGGAPAQMAQRVGTAIVLARQAAAAADASLLRCSAAAPAVAAGAGPELAAQQQQVHSPQPLL